VRPLVLATALIVGFASAAQAENDGTSVRLAPDSALTIGPTQSPLPTAEPAPPVATQQPAVQPAPAPVPAPAPAPVVAAKPWPENVPSLKPGTDKAAAAVAAAQPKAAPAATTQAATTTQPAASTAASGTSSTAASSQGQVASLPPEQPANAASLIPTKVTLQASIFDGSKVINEPLVWSIHKPSINNKKLSPPIASNIGPRGEFSVPPGDYVVVVKQREAIVSQPLTVGSVEIKKTIAINTSIVAVGLIPYTGAKRVTEPIHWEVFSSALGKPGPDSKVADAVAPATSFTVAAGYYVVRAHYKDTKADLAMLVEPGVSYNYTVDLYSANVVAQVVDAKGKPVKDVTWQVVRATAGSDGTHEVVATDTGASPTFLLREGNYTVIATGADGSVGQTPLATKAGQTHKVKVTLKPASTTKAATSG
jgi:hypothetical protein